MDWTRGPAVGRGSSATVYLATTTSSGHQFAVKTSDLSSSALLKKEHSLLSNLNSPYLINCLGFNVEIEASKPPMFNLFMEYLPDGTLWDAIQSHGGRMDESTIGAYSRQILKGLEYLHANGLAHCDIKSRNLLLSGDNLKIADLGCAKFVEGDGDVSGNGFRAFSGSPAFMAPEVARGEEQGFPADIWAFGCTVIEMATGNHPWSEMEDPASALYRIGFSDDSPEIPLWFSESARDFVAKCLIKDPRERWTAKRLLEHPFLQGFDSESVIECSKMKSKNSSPSFVLDQSFWSSSMEDLETPLNLTNQASKDSLTERIRNLAGNLSLNCDWEGDDRDWIMIRNNGVGGESHGNESTSSVFNIEIEEDFELLCVIESEGLELGIESDFMLKSVKFEGSNENCSSSLIQIDLLLHQDLHLLLLFVQNFTIIITLFKNHSLIDKDNQVFVRSIQNKNLSVSQTQYFDLSNITWVVFLLLSFTCISIFISIILISQFSCLSKILNIENNMTT